MVCVASSETPFKCVQGGHIYVLKKLVSGITAIFTRAGNWKGVCASRTLGIGETAYGPYKGGAGKNLRMGKQLVIIKFLFVPL